MPISNSATMNRAKVKRGNAMKKRSYRQKENNDSDSGHHNSRMVSCHESGTGGYDTASNTADGMGGIYGYCRKWI